MLGHDPINQVLQALGQLQDALPLLDPAQKAVVEDALPFATPEWQDNLVRTITRDARDMSPASSVAALDLVNKTETGVAARIRLTPDSSKLILVLVGLPARGKSLLGRKLEQFLCWRGYQTKTFSLGGRRRGESNPDIPDNLPGAARPPPAGSPSKQPRAQFSTASFFDPNMAFATAKRDQLSLAAFDELLAWLHSTSGQIAIFDACNVTAQRRAQLSARANRVGFGIVFIESIVTDAEAIRASMQMKVKHSADYVSMPEAAAMEDLHARIEHYEKVYETVEEAEGAYIKVFDLKAKVHACNIYGRINRSVLPYLLSIHVMPKRVFLLMLKVASVGRGCGRGAVEGRSNPHPLPHPTLSPNPHPLPHPPNPRPSPSPLASEGRGATGRTLRGRGVEGSRGEGSPHPQPDPPTRPLSPHPLSPRPLT
mmetsp:Transcript_7989/g.23628  ORF Transcript_7989/g.23628 Transcript_7989/m.23628 type:complete len:426 (-) Transcript_7989:800-2077(-)